MHMSACQQRRRTTAVNHVLPRPPSSAELCLDVVSRWHSRTFRRRVNVNVVDEAAVLLPLTCLRERACAVPQSAHV